MSASLQSLQVVPRGPNGWGTRSLEFGRITTLVLGPGGAGKTPLIKALAYVLGHPVELPPLVREKCQAVALGLAGPGGPYRVERRIAEGVDVVVSNDSRPAHAFHDEKAFSAWIFEQLGIPPRTLTNKKGGRTQPYMSVVGPMFLVDQDLGWTTSYAPFETHQFIKDQREEVVRLLLGIPPRNRPVDRAAFDEAKVEQASLQEQVAFKRRALESLLRELGEDQAPDAIDRLTNRRASLERDLTRVTSVLETASGTESVLDLRTRGAAQRLDEVRFRLENARRRKSQLLQVQQEVGAELQALEQNEVAADAFRLLCGNAGCGFFRKPEESYGRRVLYLRDQLKDFESSTSETERELAGLEEQAVESDRALQQAIEEKKRSLAGSDAEKIVHSVDATSRELADVTVRLDRLERIQRQREQLDVLINRESAAMEEVAELKPARQGRTDNARLLDARQLLTAAFKEWLLALRTPNMPADITFDEELRLVIGGETFSSKSSPSGSTRTRLVLAYHAALVETSLSMGGNHPRLLVLDAPRQHELSADDLRSFLTRFYALSAKVEPPVQLVLSATEGEIAPQGRVDRVWEPAFTVDGKPRFLGPVGVEA